MREIVTSQKIAGELQSPGTRTVTSREGRPSVRAGKVGTKALKPAAPYAVPSGESRHGVEPGLQPLGNTALEPAGAVDNSLSMDRAAVCMASGTDRRRSVSCYRKGASFDSSTAARSAIAVGCICGLETPRAGSAAYPGWWLSRPRAMSRRVAGGQGCRGQGSPGAPGRGMR